MLGKTLQRAFTNAAGQGRVHLKALPYEMGALEPIISGHLLEFHYGKHHRTYVNNLNNLLDQQTEALNRGDIKAAVGFSHAIQFNGGGHLNHEFFWDSLCPQSQSTIPTSGHLHDLIVEGWGSFDKFIEVFNTRTASIQGSGWGWLCFNKRKGKLSFYTTSNQDLITDVSPNLVPLLNIDVWEHAYYLDYKNARPQYLSQMWKIINWQRCEERLAAAIAETEAAKQA